VWELSNSSHHGTYTYSTKNKFSREYIKSQANLYCRVTDAGSVTESGFNDVDPESGFLAREKKKKKKVLFVNITFSIL
jgi:hypothetical protein